MNKIILKSTMTALGLFLAVQSHAETSFEQEVQQGCAKISQYKHLGQKLYDQKQYKKALEQFKNQAAWTPFCQFNGEEFGINISDKEVDIANNNVGLTYAKMNQPMWARAWFQIESTKMSKFNLNKLPKPQISSDYSGQYVSYAGFGEWNYITVKKLKNNYHIEFEGLYMGTRGLIYGPNTGSFETNMPLNKNKTKTAECNITLEFSFSPQVGNFVAVNQPDMPYGCGYFGMNVSADGVYLKVEK